LQTDIFWTLSWPFSCDYSFWLRDLKFGMCIKDLINKTCWKNGKDLSNGAPTNKLWNHTKKTHFPGFAKNFRRPWMKLKIFFCQFPNPWTLRVSGMGGYTSKCEKVKITAPYCLRRLDYVCKKSKTFSSIRAIYLPAVYNRHDFLLITYSTIILSICNIVLYIDIHTFLYLYTYSTL
jgi:hypothetical protein